MDQEKIGKLIATLRKEKGLTQGELGAKVGVGDRAVSKWERGITCPDISILNELSSILGITSDELLKGELNNVNKEISHKSYKKLLLLIPIFIIAIGISLFIYNRSKGDVYHLKSMDDNYSVEGQALFKNNKIYVNINEIIFRNKEVAKTKIIGYEYVIYSNNEFLYRYGYVDENTLIDSNMTIENYAKTVNVSFESNLNVSEKEIVNNGLTLRLTFKDVDENMFDQEIKISLNLDK